MDFHFSDEQKMLVETARDLARRELAPRAAEWDRTDEFPHDAVEALAKSGLLGLGVPTEYGGGGGSILDLVLVSEQLSVAYPACSFILGAQSGLGSRTINLFGTAEMKESLLPKFVTGEKLVSWAMSEPGVGSDIGAMRTNATRIDGGWRINGEKTWISLAQVAEVFILITRFEGTPGLPGIGAVVLHRDNPGLEISAKIKTLGIHSTGMASLFLDDCEVSDDAVLFGPGQFRSLLQIMSGERVSGNPPVSLGIAAAALEAAKQYLPQRMVSGQPLSDYQGLRWKIADMAIKLECARTLVYRAASNAGEELPSSFEASVAKVVANEAAVDIADAALQMHGAAGYTTDMPLERFMRDARGMLLGDGTVEIQRNLIADHVLGRRAKR